MRANLWTALSVCLLTAGCGCGAALGTDKTVEHGGAQSSTVSAASSNFGWTVTSGFVGALLALILKHIYDRWQAGKTRRRRAGALRAEINYCARLARTYLIEPYTAPLYRFPNAVFNSMYPHLVSDALTGADIEALTGFFSLVDQMNRGLDAIDQYRAARDEDSAKAEINRLKGKAEQMAHPTDASRVPGESLNYYAGAIAAVDRHAA